MRRRSRRPRLSQNEFNRFFDLCRKQDWLERESDAFEELIGVCDNPAEQNLIIDLLSRFTYLTNDMLTQHLNSLAHQLAKGWELPPEKTQIVATAFDSEPDSSQWLLQLLKTVLPKHGLSGAALVNRCDKAINFSAERPNIVLVDEFIGSGQTLMGRIDTLRKRLRDKGTLNNCSLKVAVMASMAEGKNKVGALGIEVHANLVLQKGLSYYLQTTSLASALAQMKRLESLLLQTINGQSLPSLGYGEAEALYGRELGNVPNSVFPIFWWPKYSSGANRQTLLCRWEVSS